MSDRPAPLALHPAWRVCLLGMPCVVRPDGSTVPLEPKDAALLALLAVKGPLPRARAAALLWPKAGEAQGRRNLRQRLFRLRHQVGCELLQGSSALHLADDLRLDVVDALRRLAEDPRAAEGELLAGHDYGHADELDAEVNALRDQWRAQRVAALADRASDLEKEHQIALALMYAKGLLDADPTQEHAHRRVMRLHYLRGDRAAALAAYEHCQRVLGERLGMRPSAETRDLARTVEASATLGQALPAQRPLATVRPPRLVGREAQWEQFEQAWQARAVVVVEGEAGIGKTRLLEDIAWAHGESPVFAARPGDSSIAYASLARALRGLSSRFGPPYSAWTLPELARVVPELGVPAGGEFDRLRFSQAVAQAFADWHSSGLQLIVMDDLHYADDASLEWLSSRFGSMEAERIVWMFGVRSQEMPARLRDCIDSAELASGHHVVLGALDRAAIQALVDSLGIQGLDATAWAPVLERHAGGNPFFLLETLAELMRRAGPVASGAKVPSLPMAPKVHDLIERRLKHLTLDALQLVQVAAVAGQDFSAALAMQVMQRSALDLAAAWRELESAHCLRGEIFTHDLVQETTLGTLPAPLARELHRDVATFLAAHQGEPARLAQHWREAQRWLESGHCFLQASANARHASQRALDADLAGQAAACFEQANDQSGAFQARQQQCEAAYYVEPYPQQLVLAERLLERASSPAQRCVAWLVLARILVQDVRDERVLAAAAQARQLAAAAGEPLHELTAARFEARALARMNRVEAAQQLVARYTPAVKALGTDRQAAQALSDFGCTLMTCDRHDDASALFEAAREIASRLEDWAELQHVEAHFAWVHHFRGDIERATACYESARALAPRLGAAAMPPGISDALLGRFYCELGRFGEGVALLEATRAALRATSSFDLITIAEAMLAHLFLRLGQPGRAAAVLGAVAEDAAPYARRTNLSARALIAAHEGSPSARSLAERALAAACQEGGAFPRLAVEAVLAPLLPPDEGARLAFDACARSEAAGLAVTLWPLKVVACEALRRAGRSDEAVAMCRQIVQRFEALAPTVLYAPQYWWTAAQCFYDIGEEAAGSAALHAALRWIRETALPNVPPAFKDSFLQRNSINRAVLAESARRFGSIDLA